MEGPNSTPRAFSTAGTPSSDVLAAAHGSVKGVGPSVEVGAGYTGIWAQSLISATSTLEDWALAGGFLVMVNANKFVIIGIEAFGMQTKVLTTVQLLGGTISILGGVLYGKARQAIEEEADEKKNLLPKDVPKAV